MIDPGSIMGTTIKLDRSGLKWPDEVYWHLPILPGWNLITKMGSGDPSRRR